jgi:2-amino-4-hydroxy-6-hydroxymethyldihydropteridine diphosphokinase
MNKAVLSIGSNVDPEKNIPEARRRLKEIVHVLSESRFVMTKALLPKAASEPLNGEAEDFINGAVLVETEMERDELELTLKNLEREMGRVRTKDKYAPRTIDIDVVAWNEKIIDSDVRNRDFLKQAVLEVWPEVFLQS